MTGGYKELLLISTRGTPDARITIKGIPDPVSGALPVIEGAGAVLAPQFRSHYAPLSGSGAVMVGARPGFVAGLALTFLFRGGRDGLRAR